MHYKLEASEVKEWKILNPHGAVFIVPEVTISIDNWAFADSPQLKKIVLPSKLVELGYKAFENSNNIEEICFSNGEEKSQGGRFVITNGYLYDAFTKKIIKVFSNSEVIEIPEGVKYLSRLCFAGRKNLKKVIIPASVKSMEVSFENCNSLREIIVSKDNEVYEVKENCLYEKRQGILERVITTNKDFVVPDFIKEIRASAIPYCVTGLSITNKVKTINASAAENPSLSTWIKEWRKAQQKLKNEIKEIVEFNFTLSNLISRTGFLEVSRNGNDIYRGRVFFEKSFANELMPELEKIIGTRKNYSLIHFKQPEKKDLVFVIENFGEKFSKIHSAMKDASDRHLLLVTILYPDENGEYKEFVRMTDKSNFVRGLHNLIAKQMPELKSNLIESILEMDDLESYYERIE